MWKLKTYLGSKVFTSLFVSRSYWFSWSDFPAVIKYWKFVDSSDVSVCLFSFIVDKTFCVATCQIFISPEQSI